MWTKRNTRAVDELPQPGVALVGLVTERASQDVLAVIVRTFLGVSQIAVAGVELLRQKEEAADLVAEVVELRLVAELVGMTLKLVRPDVFDLIAFLTTRSDVLDVSFAKLVGCRFQVVRDVGKDTEDLFAILPMHVVAGILVEVVLVLDQFLSED